MKTVFSLNVETVSMPDQLGECDDLFPLFICCFTVCLHVWGKGVGVQGTEHMWKLENNSRKLVLSFHSVNSRD